MKYRIFTNDRGRKGGVAMYSALCEVAAGTPEQAVRTVNPEFGKPPLEPIKAVEWPATSAESKRWLAEHV